MAARSAILTVMTITTTMTTDAALLRLTHWFSPVFPVGGFAYSAGLETAISDGFVTDEQSLFEWLDTSLLHGSARVDAVLLTSAMEPGADLSELSDWARALSGSRERWQETLEQGTAFARALEATGEGDGVAYPLPVAVGAAVRTLSLPPERVAALFLQSMIANLATVAVRHIPLGQGAGSRVIGGLGSRILQTSEAAMALAPEDAFSATPGADLVQIRHETQETRIFRT